MSKLLADALGLTPATRPPSAEEEEEDDQEYSYAEMCNAHGGLMRVTFLDPQTVILAIEHDDGTTLRQQALTMPWAGFAAFVTGITQMQATLARVEEFRPVAEEETPGASEAPEATVAGTD